MQGIGRYRGGVLAVAVGLVLAGCGADGGEATSSGAGSSAAAGTRTVEHAAGTTEVEGTPERVVVLDTGELDAVLALGVTPVGAVRTSVSDELPAYIEDAGADPADIANVGTIAEPDLEAIAALTPDLILSNAVRHTDIYDQLSAIAPTVFAEAIGETWQENLRLAGEALDRSEAAEELLAAHAERAAEVGALFGDPADTEVSMVRFLDGSAVRLYGEGSFIGAVLADVGFARPELQRTGETFVEVAPENIGEADGDLLFHASYGEEGQAAAGQVTAGGLWTGLSAVQNGRAFEVSDDRWFLAIGPLGASLVLDDLEEIAGRSVG
ncbi:ABC transporter substrate-binding protein [Geodermatophilus sabuli]|uniref:Iron complex transport system substrate-binding protein n=1 Tax=Geodermatophilus sabuli TaxID=1564158 RepID=A0A285E5F7_9ACTN|nr:iron-siderophore ABC transporter substrate-binding protein [Geodermatophilus sabuli]MBB3082816.1 iron complex transport system substrate-binding protein [Geodermatophilus sabuli]SNX94319.1 iron complex transport system substrate-binding protein [Geodermatophilus sabuli]